MEIPILENSLGVSIQKKIEGSRPVKKLDPGQYSPYRLFPGLIQVAVYENSARR